MTITGTKVLKADTGSQNNPVYPTSLMSSWSVALDAGKLSARDVAVVKEPEVDIEDGSGRLFKREMGLGSVVLLRMVYDKTLTAITSPEVVLFGRANSSDQWMRLPRVEGGSRRVVLTADPTTNEVRGGSPYIPEVEEVEEDLEADPPVEGVEAVPAVPAVPGDWAVTPFVSVDAQGCNEFMLAVEVALAGSTGDIETAFVESKII